MCHMDFGESYMTGAKVGILLAIAISAVLGPGFTKVIIAIGISGMAGYARHIIPNAISPLIVQMAMGIASAGLLASALSFLGFGVQAPTPEWGSMLSSARSFIRDYPHMCIIPGVFIMLTVLSFNLLGDAIRDALDPKRGVFCARKRKKWNSPKNPFFNGKSIAFLQKTV